MDPAHYNTALALYFVSYVIFEVPANVSKATYQDPYPSSHHWMVPADWLSLTL